jgi:hypothetical protein
MKNQSKRVLVSNMLGGMGYIFCLLAWGWTGMLFLPAVLANKHVEHLLLPTPADQPAPPPATYDLPPAMTVAALVITALVMIATVIVLLRAPVTIARTGQAVTARAANSALPLITHGRPLPAVKKRRLTARLIKLSKLLLTLLPVIIISGGWFMTLPLPFDVAIFVSCILAISALFWFSLQYLMAARLGIKSSRLM